MRISVLWRLLALGMLLVYVVLVLAVVRLLVHNLGLALLVGISGGAIIYAAWLLFTARRFLGWLFLLAGITGVAISGWWFVHGTHNWRMVAAVAGLSVVYLGFAGLLRYEYWRSRRRYGEHTASTARFKRPFLIINPKSGDGRALRARIPERAREQGITVLLMQPGDSVETLARQAASQGADVLGVSGGDGSIGAVAKVALEHDLPVVVLPGGTRCHFARDLGLDPARIVDSLQGFAGVRRRIDVGVINGRVFLNNASFGLYADIVSQSGYRAHKLRTARSVLTAHVRGTRQAYPLDFRRGQKRFHQAVQLLVGVGRYDTLHVFELGQRQQLDAGLLQVTAVTRLDDALVRQLLKTMSLDQLHGARLGNGMEQWTTQELTVASNDTAIRVGVDGEFEEYESPVHLSIRPKALEIYVPAEGERGRARRAFDPALVQKTWRAAAAGHD